MENNKEAKKENEVVIDAQGSVLGRLSTFAAKKALQGQNVIVVNSEEAIIIGDQKEILEKYLHRFRLGHGVQKGPLFSRKSTELVRRAIRGMVGRKKTRGREAIKRVRCYEGVPIKYKKAEKTTFKKDALNFITIKKLSSLVRQK